MPGLPNGIHLLDILLSGEKAPKVPSGRDKLRGIHFVKGIALFH